MPTRGRGKSLSNYGDVGELQTFRRMAGHNAHRVRRRGRWNNARGAGVQRIAEILAESQARLAPRRITVSNSPAGSPGERGSDLSKKQRALSPGRQAQNSPEVITHVKKKGAYFSECVRAVFIQKKTFPGAPDLRSQFIAFTITLNYKIPLVINGIADPSNNRIDDGFFKAPTPKGDRHSRQ